MKAGQKDKGFFNILLQGLSTFPRGVVTLLGVWHSSTGSILVNVYMTVSTLFFYFNLTCDQILSVV